MSDSTATPMASDALVVFGVSGDLAYKKIFPALYGMCRDGELDVPVIGVAIGVSAVKAPPSRL